MINFALEAAARQTWDVVVVGAGPAGAMASYQLAKRGVSVLLVERASFPRQKVCGSCLNAASVSLLQEEGLGDILIRNRAPVLNELQITCGSSRAVIPLPEGAALSREVLDQELVREAVARGASFLDQTQATLGNDAESSTRRIQLSRGQEEIFVQARVILSADGLGGQFLEKETGFAAATEPTSRIGVGKIFKDAPDFYEPGKIYMACANHGYLGLVRLEDGRLNLAACLDREFLKDCGRAGKAAQKILEENHLPLIQGMEDTEWLGTFPLTRKRKIFAARQIFVIGDSAGYTEPFTGEGIAFALATGIAAADFVMEGIQEWTTQLELDWTKRYRELVIRRQTLSRLLAKILRHPLVTEIMVEALSHFPELASPWIEKTNSIASRGAALCR